MALFYSTGLTYFINKFKPQFQTRKLKNEDFFPVVYMKHIGISHIINKGIQSLTKFELRTVFLNLIFVFVFVRDYMNPKKILLEWLMDIHQNGFQFAFWQVHILGNSNKTIMELKKLFYS